jgi:hypothetical protein
VHSQKLAVSDFFGKEPYATMWESNKEILRENEMAIAPPTRWSGKCLAIKHIRLTKGAKVHVVSPTEYGRIGVVEKALHPFFSATQILHSKGRDRKFLTCLFGRIPGPPRSVMGSYGKMAGNCLFDVLSV